MTKLKKVKSKKHIVAAVVLVVFASGSALAQDFQAGGFLVRARAVSLDSANKDSTGLDLGQQQDHAGSGFQLFLFGPNLAAELVLTVP